MTNHAIFSSPEPKAQGELIGWDSLGGGLTALGFGPDQIRTLVSMATDISHRVIMGKTLWPL